MKDIVALMFAKAKKKKAKIVVCEGWDERVLEAAHNLVKNNVCSLVLLGTPDQIKKKSKEKGFDLGKTEIIDYKHSPLKKEFIQKLYLLRQHKGMTLEEAAQLLEDENYFGCMYAYCGYADAVAGSCICSTAALMSPVMRILRKKDALVSEVSFMKDNKNDRVLFITDCSLNPNPTVEELAVIAENGAKIAEMFDFEPKVALLSFSTYGSGGADKPEVKFVKDAVALVKSRNKFLVDGEMQGDAAVNPKSAARKCPTSPLKGEANVLVFPNLQVANIVVHLLIQLSTCEMIGTILSGLQKPVSILGRSATAKMIEEHIACCAMQVQK